nr:tetratricopeptide repeat protein [Thermoanaerobaculia bacterium]
KNVLLEEKRAFADLRRALASYDRSFKPPGAVDPEARAALAALGYVGSVAGEAKEGPLPDPRGQLPFLRQLRGAFAFHAKGEYAEAAKAFRAVLAVNPTMVDALEYLGRALEQLGQREEALATYKKALALSQGAPHIALAAASLYLEMGDLKAAEEHARLALVAHPSFAHGVLSQIALARKDLDGAEREAREAMAAGENRIGPVVTLAAVLEARGRYEEVLELTAQAEATYRSREAQDKALLRGLYLTRGQALADLGRREEAEVALRKEIELFPQDPRAYSSLAILCALTGRPGEVPDLLRRMVETRPSAGNYAEAVKTLRILRDPASAQALLAHALKLYPGSPDLAALR